MPKVLQTSAMRQIQRVFSQGTAMVAAIALTIGVALLASVLAARGRAGMPATADEPARSSVVKPPTRSDAEAIQGTWMVTAIEQVNYQPSEDEKAYWKSGRFTITITADRLTFDVDKSSMKYRLNPSTSPRRMLWIKPDDPGGKVVAVAFYSLEGDDLKICVGRADPKLTPQPPHGFDIKKAPKGTFPTLFVMKRKMMPVQGDRGEVAKSTRPLPAMFDKPRFDRLLPGGKDEPMFIDFDSGHFLTPPFALEPVDRDRPLTLSNLAIPEKLKDWARRHGIEAAVQTDGRTITLLGLEMKPGQPVPNPDAWPILTFADALRLIEPFPDQPRTPDAGEWPRFAREFQPGAPPIVLPFLTREGSVGLLNLRMDRTEPRDIEGIRLTYQIGRGLVPRGDELAPGRAARRSQDQALLDDLAGPVQLQTWKGGIVLTRPGSPEWIEIDQGKVVVKVNPPGRSGPDEVPETLIEASRLVTDVMDLDGRRLRATIKGSSKAMICRRVRDRIEVGEVDSRVPTQPMIVKPDSIIACDRITLDLPYFQHLSKDPRVDDIQRLRKR
ncbi:MAG: TIGR03067 domain-containing protein [Isosphaeraceae bacterium]